MYLKTYTDRNIFVFLHVEKKNKIRCFRRLYLGLQKQLEKETTCFKALGAVQKCGYKVLVTPSLFSTCSLHVLPLCHSQSSMQPVLSL